MKRIYGCRAGGGKNDNAGRAKKLSDGLRQAAAGFLLARGLAGGAVACRWSMAALAGGEGGSLYGAALFGAGCALVWTARRSLSRGASRAAEWLTFALYALWYALGRDDGLPWAAHMLCAGAVLAAMALACGWTSRLALAAAVMLPAAVFAPAPGSVELTLRLSAILGGLYCAGLAGLAAEGLTRPEKSGEGGMWLIAGLAAGLL